jgi:hypothetical protein
MVIKNGYGKGEERMSDIAARGELTQIEINNVLWGGFDTFHGKTDSTVDKDYILFITLKNTNRNRRTKDRYTHVYESQEATRP